MLKPNYVCPQRFSRDDIPFIMCKAQMKNGKRYETIKECEQIICGHVYFCNRVRRWENTDGAKTCPYNKNT